eukprot:UN01066
MCDSDDESDNDMAMERKQKQKLLGNFGQNDTNKNRNNCNDAIYNNFDDEVSGNGRIYSPLSQSQSEKQMEDMVKDFGIYSQSQSQSQNSEEMKEGADNEQDYDIEIIPNLNSKQNTKPFVPKRKPKFKAPKFKNGAPPIKQNKSNMAMENRNFKKKINTKTKVSVKKKGKIKKKNSNASNQKTLLSFWKAK